MRVLGIESSCDETAAAVVHADGTVLSDVVHGQTAVHAPYGGVVPELASRDHLRASSRVVREALARAGLALADVDAIAVTTRPGLTGALLVGVQIAKGLAWAAEKPLVGVDHLVGHLLAAFLRREGAGAPPTFPFVALLASGGHTAIYRVDGAASAAIRELGATRDDAAGEAFDKIAKLVGLGYPGGPVVDRRAARGDPSRVEIPLPMPRSDSLELSFSGLKSHVARRIALHGAPRTSGEVDDLCAAFQRVVVTTLVQKTMLAARRERVRTVVLGGGVAANRELRARMADACASAGVTLVVPPFASCTDNAAMIAYAGAQRLLAGERDGLDVGVASRTSLERVTRKGGGPRAERRRGAP